VSRAWVALERVAILLAGVGLAVGLIAVLSGFFAGRDQAGVSAPAAVPGQAYADLGHGLLRPGQPRPAYNSDPPTSGAHHPARITRDAAALSDDQLLSALASGDVVIFYGSRQPPAALRALARTLAPPFSPALAAGGRALVLARRPGISGLIAVAWTHLLPVRSPGDPRLRAFVGDLLGRGASAPCC
jgi:hypothetical protein